VQVVNFFYIILHFIRRGACAVFRVSSNRGGGGGGVQGRCVTPARDRRTAFLLATALETWNLNDAGTVRHER